MGDPAGSGAVTPGGGRTGTTSTATTRYLTPDPTGRSNATQTQSIAATYVKPFYYYTDATLTLKLTGAVDPSAPYKLTYTIDGASKTADVTASNNTVTLTVARNANASAQHFVLKGLEGDSFGKDENQSVTADLPVGSAKTVDVKMVAKGVK